MSLEMALFRPRAAALALGAALIALLCSAASAAAATEPMSETLGLSLTHRGFAVDLRTAPVRRATPSAVAPNAIPPSFTLGHDALTSMAASEGSSESLEATAE